MKEQKHKPPEPPRCMFNDGVVCWPNEKTCDKCGWCPKVAAMRIQRLKERKGGCDGR